MSAIAAIYHLDGRLASPEDLDSMTSVLAHRGPDGARIWCHGPAGLGHRLLRTTPESLHERSPAVSLDGVLALTADVRLDNRADLLAALGLSDSSAPIPDPDLIVAAYARWGPLCLHWFLGDFAFALWDQRRRMLFCARDHFGVKPLYYCYRPGQIFACASEIKALLCLPGVQPRLNEVRVADYLGDLSEDKESTFYQGILRLPPAHSLTVGVGTMQSNQYWSLDPSAELRLASDRDYAEAWRDIFTEAVRCRLRSAFPRGSHLSGGLDSSAVTCMARRLMDDRPDPEPLHTFSNVFDRLPECDERPFIDVVLGRGAFCPHFVHPEKSSPLVESERVFWHQDEPSIGPNHFLPWELNRAASQEGVRVILDGFDGDTTVSHGAARFAELARAGQWQAFAAEANALASHFSVSPLALLRTYGFPYLEELATGHRWVAFAAATRSINTHFLVSRRELWRDHGLRALTASRLRGRRHGPVWRVDPLVNTRLADRVALLDRHRVLTADRATAPRSAREQHWRSLTSGLFTSVLEISDRCAAAFSIDVRHPFMDKRLIDFCLSLPSEQKLSQGWSRMVLRRALEGILPEDIRWRGGKTNMNPNFVRGLLTNDRPLIDEVVLRRCDSIAEYADIDVLRAAYERVVSRRRVKIDDAMTVWKAVTLACWLRGAGFADTAAGMA